MSVTGFLTSAIDAGKPKEQGVKTASIRGRPGVKAA
jgi:hypothetical protein